ncbi:hypothetical protein ONZ51_g6647 [Trametes cubensis]|uniref:DUF1793-domain-containing protein n=1 Tax=Trametes cubensis TaxID=1111947 RepID=A0AAD7TUB4_9APHY|nr:hypothetical protein ONZ51_g6647 [Trametes cubensis]
MFSLAFLVFLFTCFTVVLSATSWTANPFNPASIPLAVRSPYFSAWLNQGEGTALNAAWPTFWTGGIVGWAGFAKVDGVAYNWLGDPGIPGVNFTKTTQKSFEFTSTQSIFVMTAGPVDLTITFLSPVEPSNLVNQSFPFSYLSVSAASNDGNDHSVQVYADISAEWVSGDDSLQVQWTTSTGATIAHQVQLSIQEPFTEINDRAQCKCSLMLILERSSAPQDDSVTFQTGQDIVVRAQFINHGALPNAQDSNFRGVSANWPVFALARDLGKVNSASTSATAVFAVGHVRDPAVQYITASNGVQQRSSLFMAQASPIYSAITTFLSDYDNALARARAFDAQVNQDAAKVSTDYAAVVALSIRQVFGAIELTVSKTSSGDFNTSDIMVFMKELSTGGAVNTADVIFPAWPLFLYINPAIGKQLLQPLLAYQATGQYPNPWAAHDVGHSYPNATGHNDGKDLALPVEETGNMLIMTLSYTQRTNDTSLVTAYYDLLDRWAQYLVQNSLNPPNQLSTDVFAGSLANQTNLAIKGIIGIKAMSEIAAIAGDSAKSASYSATASKYAQEWEQLAMSTDGTHLTLSYGNSSSWGLKYNLYADKLLGTNIFSQSIFDLETKWYSTRANTYGVPLDTRNTYSKPDWQMWTAALVSDNTVRDTLITSVLKYASDGLNARPLPDLYDTVNGTALSTQARPVVGGHLALAHQLTLQSKTAIAPSNSSIGSSGSSSTTPTSPGSGGTSGGSSPGTTTSTNSTEPTQNKPNSAHASSSGRRDRLVVLFGAVSMAAFVIA